MTNPTDRSPSDDEIRNRLPPLHYHVAQEAGAERAFTSGYWDTKDAGVYLRVVCETALFGSSARFHFGTGWPGFDCEIRTKGVPFSRSARSIGTESEIGEVRISPSTADCRMIRSTGSIQFASDVWQGCSRRS